MEIYKEKVIKAGEIAIQNVIEQKPKAIKNKEPLMIEYARYGKDYFQNNKIKFMVVGRAPGGFKNKNDCNVMIESDNNIYSFDREKISYCFDVHCKEGLNWIHAPNKEKGKRFIDAKPFFRFAKKVYLKLTEQEQDIEWYKNICHSNIYKIVSTTGGNPSSKLAKAQEEEMINILMAEIEHFKPTHILVIDGEGLEHCWCPPKYKERLKNYASECSAKIWFSDRPEVNSADKLILRIDESFWITE